MNLFKNRFVLYGVLALVLLASGYLFYRAYAMHQIQQKYETARTDLAALEKLDALRTAAGEEQFESARYYGVRGVNYVDTLEESRQKVDQAYTVLKRWIDTQHPATVAPKALEAFFKTIREIRVRVDALDPSYEGNFDGTVRDDPLLPLLERIASEQGLGSADADTQPWRYIRLMLTRKRLTDERALLAYFAARRERLLPENMLAFESVLEGDPLPAAAKRRTSAGSASPEGAVDLAAVDEKLEGIRFDLFEHADRGDFITDLYTIGQRFGEAIGAVAQGEKAYLKEAARLLRTRIDQEKSRQIWYLFLAVMLLLIGLFFLRMVRMRQREKAAMAESLGEIASELDSARREELQTIMERGDRSAIYRFLAKTTMDARIAEERAHHAEKAKDIFLANMSHEIRTPLNGILGFTQLMQSTPLNPEQKEFMSVIAASSENLLKIVNDILDLSKLHANKIELESIPFSIVQNIEQAVEPHAARALEKEIEYSAFIDPSLPMVLGDPTKLTQVMTNLIGNAVKFTNSGGTVDIDVRSIKSTDDQVTIRFSIKDSGIGISPEKRMRIFEPFAQADVSTTREFGGTGLGLTITRDILLHMGSVLEVVSEEGKGSEFFFEIDFMRAGVEEEIQTRLEGVHFAYYHAGESTLRQMERNLALYIRASGGRFRMVSDQELDLLDDVDIFLLDYSNKETREKFDSLIHLGKKTIVISTVAQKHDGEDFFNQVDRIIYRPLTASKLIRAYESLDVRHKEVHEQQRVEDNALLEGLKILVAEDNPINQKLIARVLEGMGIVPILVDNGKEALDIRLAQSFDAILMDIQMPVMGGVESTREILRYEQTRQQPHIPIIALTANALQGDRERYLSEGFDDYVSKPINIDQLRQVLRTHCAPRSAQEALTENTPRNGRRVVMYTHADGLTQRLHRDALTYAGHAFDTVADEEALDAAITDDPPDYLLLDAYTAGPEGCRILSAAQAAGIALLVYGTWEPSRGCPVDPAIQYTAISMLISKLNDDAG